MSELKVTIPCACGRNVTARARDAGGSVACSCGKVIPVPNLSKLRALAGADPFVTNPAEAIRKLQDQGMDPAGRACLSCGSSTATCYKCHAVCESSHLKRSAGADSPSVPGMMTLLFLPHFITWLLFCFRRVEPQEAERRGYDIEVSFNLPVCEPCTSTIGSVTRTSVAKQMMLKVPLYKELLEYYPNMKLEIKRG